MRVVDLPRIGTVAAWRAAARGLAATGTASEEVLWRVVEQDGAGTGDLFAEAEPAPAPQTATIHLPRAALPSIETALCHRDPERFARAYDIVLRLSRGALRWGDRSDSALHRLLAQEKAVRRDIHKMHAFVRFREVGDPGAGRRAFFAWFEPDHLVTEAVAPFFARRFGQMDWVIATPDVRALFRCGTLRFDLAGPGERPPADASEELWRLYYASIFNPARLAVSAMTSEMPKKYWKNLPEADLIPDLIRSAHARSEAMRLAAPSLPPVRAERIAARRSLPIEGAPEATLDTLKPLLDRCRRCPLGACATQAVAGEGPADASLMLVGEQPGDTEDLQGRPFVGPAGQVLAECLVEAGLDRGSLYATNAVKHFKFHSRGKQRLHQRPDAGEIAHCKWWLDLEIGLLRPKLIVALGATAARALTGDGTAIRTRRGGVESGLKGIGVLVTLHPSYILRSPDAQHRQDALAMLKADLARAKDLTA